MFLIGSCSSFFPFLLLTRSIFPYFKIERSSPTSLTIDDIMSISFLLSKDSYHSPIVIVRLCWNALYESKALRIQYRVCQMFYQQLKVEPLSSSDHMIGAIHEDDDDLS